MSTTITICESVSATEARVDREAGIVRNVRILGRESVNRRIYSDQAMADAARLYEGASVNIDHDRKEPLRERGLQERFGVLRNTHVAADRRGVYGDLHYLKSHPYTPQFLEHVIRFPDKIGLSHNADGKRGRSQGGKVVVESIGHVHSIDLVQCPATGTLLESQHGARPPINTAEGFAAMGRSGVIFESDYSADASNTDDGDAVPGDATSEDRDIVQSRFFVRLRDLFVSSELSKADSRGDFGLTDNNYKWDDLKAEFLRWAKQALREPEAYERDLAHFERYCRLQSVRQVTQAYVVGYREWRLTQAVHQQRDRKPGDGEIKLVCARTINREVATLRNMLNKGIAWGRIGVNPIADLKPLRHDTPRKQRRALSAAEVQAILAACPDYLAPVFRLYASSGIRRGELVSLRFTDVDFDGHCITIRASVAKSGKARTIPLDDEMLSMLADLQAKAKGRQPMPGHTPAVTAKQAAAFSRDHVFVTRANTPLKNNLLARFYAICKRAGIDGAEPGGSVDIHSLRGTFTTLAIENGASPKAVQSILGHSTLALTMGTYAKATERAKRDAVSALPFAKASTPAHIVSLDKARTVCSTPISNSTQAVAAS